MENINNIILNADAYKNDHGRMLPKETTHIFSTVIARRGNQYNEEVVVFGYQFLIQEYLTKPITIADIDQAEHYILLHGYAFNRQRWEYIIEQHQGYLPLSIMAIPEGAIVPVGMPIITIENTDPQCAWLVSYIETMFLRSIWYATTVASESFALKKLLETALRKHCGHKDNDILLSDFALHNFGARGGTSFESEILSSMAHAISFKGSDGMLTNLMIDRYYYQQQPSNIAFVSSVIASEHSVSCANSDTENEDDFGIAVKMLDLLEQELERNNNQPTIISVVIDTYNAYRFVSEYIGIRLKDRVIELGKRGGKLVLRPDSGNPVEEPIMILKRLFDAFGYHINDQGYKELPPYLGVLQGDGINYHSITEIIERLEQEKIALTNLVFGMGGKLVLPEKGRDTYNFAMKAAAQKQHGQWLDLFKNPISDQGKRSLKGYVQTFKHQLNNDFKVFRLAEFEDALQQGYQNQMVEVFRNGKVRFSQNFKQVKERFLTDFKKRL